MALPADYVSGTITLENGSADFTGTGTGWLAADFREGDVILDIAGGDNRIAVVQEITGNGAGTLSKPWEGPDLTAVAYRIRYQWDSSRVSAQSRAAIEMLGNGNLQSLAAVTGPGVVVMDGPHSIIVKPETDFINGVAYDVQVDTLADRAAYDGQTAGFAVLVSDVGDGRSAIYSKNTNSVGDWSDAAYVTGPVGPLPDIEATVEMLAPGSAPVVTETPITGGVRLDFELPEARGFFNAGTYNPATAYAQDDTVLYMGSTWIALGPTTGNAPPTLPTTSNVYWLLVARQGIDGAGTVNSVVAGSGISVDNTDPTAPVVSIAPGVTTVYSEKSGNYTAVSSDNSSVLRFTSAATLSLTAASTLSSNWHVTIVADGGPVTIDPNGSETINGYPSIIVPNGTSAEIICNGSSFFTVIQSSGWQPIKGGRIIGSGLASFDLSDLDLFEQIRISGRIWPSVSAAFWMRTSSNNGLSFDSGASDYVSNSGSPASVIDVGALVASGAGEDIGVVMNLLFLGFNKPTRAKVIGTTGADNGSLIIQNIYAQRMSTTPRNALRIFPSDGTISYSLYIEGLRG